MPKKSFAAGVLSQTLLGKVYSRLSDGFTLFCRTATTTRHPSPCPGNRLPISCRCSGPLPAGLRQWYADWSPSLYLIRRFQSVQNAAARQVRFPVSSLRLTRSSASTTSAGKDRLQGRRTDLSGARSISDSSRPSPTPRFDKDSRTPPPIICLFLLLNSLLLDVAPSLLLMLVQCILNVGRYFLAVAGCI